MKVRDSIGRMESGAQPLDFDPDLYLALNPDVADRVAEGTVAGALEHWLAEGRADERAGRRPTVDEPSHYRARPGDCHPPSEAELAAFDPDLYLDRNPDVLRSGHSRDSALDHWILHGRHEGRTCFPDRSSRRRTDLGRLLERPFGIDFYAPFSARSGLGTAARGYLGAIRAAGIPVQIVNLNYDIGAIRVATRDYDRPPRYRVSILQVNADTIETVLRMLRMEQFDDAYTICIWAWEMNVLRPDWYASFAAVDEVWCLSDFNSAAVAAISPVPVTTMNCVVTPPSRATGYDRAYFGLPDGFLFLLPFDLSSSLERKNPMLAVDAFSEAFAGQGDVHLVVKFHSGHYDIAAQRGLMRQLRGRPNVIVRAEKLSRAEMDGLQCCADCLLSPHRSEGFGLNIAEFMALGRPVIATGYGGNMDFTTEQNSYLLSYTVRALARRSGPYLPGYLWAEPDRTDLVRHMRRVVDAPDEAAAKGAAAAATVLATLSPEAIGARVLARLEALGLRGDVPPFARLLGASRDLIPPPPSAISPVEDACSGAGHPTISVIVPVYDVAPEWLLRCIESVRSQSYERWELCICDDASTRADTVTALRRYQGLDPRIRIMRLPRNRGIADASNAAVTLATGSFLLMLDDDDELTSDALQLVAAAIGADPGIDVIYGDEDKIDPDGSLCNHYHKPDWSPEHLESVMYTLHPLTVRTSLFLDVGGFRADYSGAQDYDLMLRLSRRTESIHHIPRILYHWRKIPGSASAQVDAKPKALDAGRRALEDHVAEAHGGRAAVEPGLMTGLHRVRHRVPDDLVTTIVILTNNGTIALPGRERFIMVENLVDSIARFTVRPRHRLLVVDDGHTPAHLAERYAALGVRLASHTRSTPAFNFSDKANHALRLVETESVVFMNDDMEVRNGDWLSALVEFSHRPEIGACAGKLLHADGTIQHAGVVLGVQGGAAHVYHGAPGDTVGYNGYTHVIRNYSALTAACLATRRSVLTEVGGFDTRLAVDFNDIDLCLRMRRSGYRLVYTPFSEVVHFENASAQRSAQDPREVALFQSRWRDVIDRDPYYNINLSSSRFDFALR